MTTSDADRIPIAVVANTQTPYRLHLHRRIAREIPEIRLHSVFTHEYNIAPWPWQDVPEIGTICFGKGEKGRDRLHPRNMPSDWKRGRRMINWLEEHGELQRATGLRMIAFEGYRPFNECMWVRERTLPYRTFSPPAESIVPGTVWDRLTGWCSRDGNETCYYSSRSAAFLALADALMESANA